MHNPIKIGKALQNSPFGKFAHPKINKRKNLIAISVVDDLDGDEIKELTDTTRIGDIEVKVYVKGNEHYQKHGVIYPIAVDTSMDELKNFIRA